MSDVKAQMSGGGEAVNSRRSAGRRWTIRAILVAVVALIGGALWCVYDGISASLHAEKGLHATQFTFQAIEDYVRKHNGAWPRSWKELERSSPQMDDVYRWRRLLQGPRICFG